MFGFLPKRELCFKGGYHEKSTLTRLRSLGHKMKMNSNPSISTERPQSLFFILTWTLLGIFWSLGILVETANMQPLELDSCWPHE